MMNHSVLLSFGKGSIVSEHGKPAGCLGLDGWPSFEHYDNRALTVFDCLVAWLDSRLTMRFFSAWYHTACIIAPDGPVPLHHSPSALWEWRPRIYERRMLGWSGLGSQGELLWRKGLAEATILQELEEDRETAAMAAGFSMEKACNKAEELLAACLSPQQFLEWKASNGWSFRVRGGRTGCIYRVRLGNGFAQLNRYSNQEQISYCLHPEAWMPDADVALATKLMLEDPELEGECLANAKALSVPPDPVEEPDLPVHLRQVAVEFELELI